MQTRVSNLLHSRSLSRRSALQLTGVASIGLLARPQHALAQDSAADALPEFHVVAVEYSFDLPAETPAGWTGVTLDNQGTMEHHVALLRLRDPAMRADLEAALQTPEFGAIFAYADSLGGPMIGPGSTASVLIDLPPGDYFAICAIPDADGTPHYLKGQQAPFSVTGEASAGEAPAADLSIDMSEMVFTGIPETVPAGAQIWKVSNIGQQLHEMAMVQLAEGLTVEQAMQMFGLSPATATAGGEATPAMDMSGPPPFTVVPSIAPMGPGQTNYLELDLAPGTYIAVCFIPDMATGVPHAMMGMTASFTVA